MIDGAHPAKVQNGEQTLRRVRLIRSLAILVVLGVGAALLLLSFVSYATLKAHVNAYAVDRNANISRGEYDHLVVALRALACATGGLALLLVVAKDRVERGITVMDRAVGLSLCETIARTRAAIRADSAAHRAGFAAVCGLGLGLRLHYLGLPMRYDEATTFNNYASKPLYIGLTDYRAPNNHLFHTLLVHISTGVFGTAPWAIRLPALIAGALVVPATYLLVRRLYEKGAGLLAAGLVACSSTLIEYSTNARGYTIVTLLFLLMLIVGARVIETDNVTGWAILTVLGALALYTLPPAAYAVGGALLWIAVSKLGRTRVLRDRFFWRWSATVTSTLLLAAVLYAPVAAVSGAGSITSNPYVSPKTWHGFLSALPGALRATWDAWNRDLPLPARALLAGAFVGAMLLNSRLSRSRIPLPMVVASWAGLLVLLQRVVPYPRVWLFMVPLYLGASASFLAHGVQRLFARNPRLGMAGLVAAIAWSSTLVLSSDAIRSSRETGALLDAPSVARFLRHYLRPGDTVQAIGSDSILEYYLRREGTDPTPLLYSARAGERVVVVVNSLGGQTLSQVWPASRAGKGWSSPRRIARYPSAVLYVVARA